MDIFAVVFDSSQPEDTYTQLKESYSDHFELSDGLFLIPSDEIAERVAVQVGIKGEGRSADGVVFKLNGSYAGYTTRSLWEWLTKVEGQD